MHDFPLLTDALFHPRNKETVNAFFAAELKVNVTSKALFYLFLICSKQRRDFAVHGISGGQ